jgi:shikimate dehydrogenase
MRKFGLIGYPLGHSFSEKYFREKFAAENIVDCSYKNYPLISIEEFPRLISSDSELCGLNVTIPYKTEILKYAGFSDDNVKSIGAANVLKIRHMHGKSEIYAYNSDVTGIRASLENQFGSAAGTALVLGTGGASKAVVWTLEKMGFKVIRVSRSKTGDVLTYQEINANLLGEVTLIVNTTPLGMFPDTASLPDIDYRLLNSQHTLFDLVYNPERTAFLRKGEERGCRTISGLKMLYSQADRSWEIWNDDSL